MNNFILSSVIAAASGGSLQVAILSHEVQPTATAGKFAISALSSLPNQATACFHLASFPLGFWQSPAMPACALHEILPARQGLHLEACGAAVSKLCCLGKQNGQHSLMSAVAVQRANGSHVRSAKGCMKTLIII